MSIEPIIDYAKQKFNNKLITCLEIGARYGESSKLILQTSMLINIT
jgi:hypothetical protein